MTDASGADPGRPDRDRSRRRGMVRTGSEGAARHRRLDRGDRPDDPRPPVRVMGFDRLRAPRPGGGGRRAGDGRDGHHLPERRPARTAGDRCRDRPRGPGRLELHRDPVPPRPGSPRRDHRPRSSRSPSRAPRSPCWSEPWTASGVRARSASMTAEAPWSPLPASSSSSSAGRRTCRSATGRWPRPRSVWPS